MGLEIMFSFSLLWVVILKMRVGMHDPVQNPLALSPSPQRQDSPSRVLPVQSPPRPRPLSASPYLEPTGIPLFLLFYRVHGFFPLRPFQ